MPTLAPSLSPTEMPTLAPSLSPTQMPTLAPSLSPTEMPTLAPSLSPSEARSDPHFVGLRGQTFRIEGDDGVNYALLSMPELALNAHFSTAYATGPSNAPRPQSTWMSAIAVVTPEHSIVFSVDGASCALADAAPEGEGDLVVGCDGSASIVSLSIDGTTVPVARTGVVFMAPELSLVISSVSSFDSAAPAAMTRATLFSDKLDLLVDFVGPRAAWGVAPADAPMFSHLNMRMDRLQLDLEAHGLIGITQHVKIDGHGNVIMSDQDGDVIDGQVSEYQLASLTSTDFKFSVFDAPSGEGEGDGAETAEMITSAGFFSGEGER